VCFITTPKSLDVILVWSNLIGGKLPKRETEMSTLLVVINNQFLGSSLFCAEVGPILDIVLCAAENAASSRQISMYSRASSNTCNTSFLKTKSYFFQK
jgi:hypothetical protein